MHKVETAGHAGTELGLSRLPVLKLLTGRAAIVGARGGANWRVGPRLEGGVQPWVPQPLGRMRCSVALWEVVPTWRNEQRIKADVAQDWKCMPFLVIAACPQRCDADG